jgi:hypothetical protein
MGALADLLAKGDGGGSSSPDDGGDPKKMAQASIKAFFEAGKSGDYAAATEHFASAMEHCGDYGGSDGPVEDEGGEGSGMPAVMLVAHKK